MDRLSDNSLYSFVRGEASERTITELVNIGAAQIRLEVDGVVARPDIMKKGENISPDDFLIVVLKDTTSFDRRLTPDSHKFRNYLQQLLYYLVLSEIEHGTLCIKYGTPEMFWYKRNDEGDHYLKPFDSSGPEIVSWTVYLSSDDPLRQELRTELVSRRDLFIEALKSNRVEILPRLTDFYKRLKCKGCMFMERCWNIDGETKEATRMALDYSVLDNKLSLQQYQSQDD